MGSRRGPTPRRATARVLEGIPGTVEPGFREHPVEESPVPRAVAEGFQRFGIDASALHYYRMGPCNIFVSREPAGVNGELLWHMTISTPSRHPSWDEIKVARYRLLPRNLTFGMLLPPSAIYVNVPEQDHVFQLWEISDPREPWTSG